MCGIPMIEGNGILFEMEIPRSCLVERRGIGGLMEISRETTQRSLLSLAVEMPLKRISQSYRTHELEVCLKLRIQFLPSQQSGREGDVSTAIGYHQIFKTSWVGERFRPRVCQIEKKAEFRKRTISSSFPVNQKCVQFNPYWLHATAQC